MKLNNNDSKGEHVSTVKNVCGVAATALLSASVALVATPAIATSPPARQAAPVPCGDVAELIEQINEANARGAGSILLSAGCEYELTAPAVTGGANGLPAITGIVTITGTRSTITRTSATPFRIAEVASQGSLTLNGITVSGGSATGGAGTAGGGILTAGSLSLVGSRVSDNTASFLGGGIAVAAGARAHLTSSTVSDNTAGDGGGIHVASAAQLTMDRGAVENNTADFTGGGLFTAGTTVLNNADIRVNSTETFEGGGIFAALGSLTVYGGHVEENEAASSGGGIANFDSTLQLVGTEVDKNDAGSDGGGLYQGRRNQQGGVASLIGGQVTENAAGGLGTGGRGGGIFRDEGGGSVTVSGTRVVLNRPDQCAPAGAVPGCPV